MSHWQYDLDELDAFVREAEELARQARRRKTYADIDHVTIAEDGLHWRPPGSKLTATLTAQSCGAPPAVPDPEDPTWITIRYDGRTVGWASLPTPGAVAVLFEALLGLGDYLALRALLHLETPVGDC